MPPMKIRNKQANNEEIIGLSSIPVYSFVPPSPHDDVNQHGCNYVAQCIQNQITDPKYYVAEGKEVLPVVGQRLA
jgi:hypothetical protein